MIHSTLPGIVCALAVAFMAAAAPAGAQGDDAARGRTVAERACASCHNISSGQTSARADGIPALAVAVQRPEVNAEWLRNFLASPHQRMPAIALLRDEREALISYLVGLKGS